MRTRVGYAGGSKADPTYRDLGDHTETLQVDYDPSRIGYEDLLDLFWAAHNPTSPSWSRQYASIIFYHDEDQRRLAEESLARQEAEQGRRLYTELERLDTFYLAEDYHQKYYLRSVRELAAEYLAIYPDLQAFVDSTAVARVNGYVGGNGSAEEVQRVLPELGLSESGERILLSIARGLRRR